MTGEHLQWAFAGLITYPALYVRWFLGQGKHLWVAFFIFGIFALFTSAFAANKVLSGESIPTERMLSFLGGLAVPFLVHVGYALSNRGFGPRG